jgi:hypothetical protein
MKVHVWPQGHRSAELRNLPCNSEHFRSAKGFLKSEPGKFTREAEVELVAWRDASGNQSHGCAGVAFEPFG